MKYLIVILVILLVAGGYLYWRLRPYIRMARQIFGATRRAGVFDVSRGPGEAPGPRAEESAAEPLLRCASCGTWTPASRAVRPGRTAAAYCSHACLERAAAGGKSPRRSAS